MTSKQVETSTGNQTTVVVTRIFDLPLSIVWKAWTEAESLKKWWGPQNFTCPHAEIDFRIGGKYLACMKSAEGKEYWSAGEYNVIDLYKKIVVTDYFSDNKGSRVSPSEYDMPGEWPEELIVTVIFEKINEGKSKMTMKQEGIPQEMNEECMKGWEESFDKLKRNVR